MMLTPAEIDRLTLFTAAELARKRRARGLRLNQPEAVALISDEIMEAARDGYTLAEVRSVAATLLTTDDVLPGVAEMIDLVNVDAHFDDGLKTVTVWQPVRPGNEPLDPACRPGEILVGDGDITLNDGSAKTELAVLNRGDRPVHVASHYHFFEANRDLEFDRSAAFGKRLDLPAGASARFDPGEHRRVTLTAIAGSGDIQGFNRLTEGNIHDPDVRARALARARERGFRGA